MLIRKLFLLGHDEIRNLGRSDVHLLYHIANDLFIKGYTYIQKQELSMTAKHNQTKQKGYGV